MAALFSYKEERRKLFFSFLQICFRKREKLEEELEKNDFLEKGRL